MSGLTDAGEVTRIRVVPEGSAVMNFAFDVTAAALVSGLITERGVIAPTRRGAGGKAFPERVV